VTTTSRKQAHHSKLRRGENKNNLELSLMEKCKYAYEEGHCIGWNTARVIHIEPHNIHTKYKEADHMACVKVYQPT
jgi:hypothetical protein